MKKILIIFAATLLFLSGIVFNANAQMPTMTGRSSGVSEEIYEHTIREEAEGKEVWQKLQNKEINCADLNEEQFGVLGEYFMGQMMGDSHAAMNAMMVQMMGEKGEEQMHTVVGKRLSSCDTSAAFPAEGTGFMPMMNMLAPFGTEGSRSGMMGNWSSPTGFNSMNNMMNFGYGFGFFGWIFMILWWALIIIGIVALIRWLSSQSRGSPSTGGSKSALDILKERYARGEIDKKEFEEKSREIKN